MKVNRLVAAVALACAALGSASGAFAEASPPSKIAVLALVGDSITIDEYRMSTGSNVTEPTRQRVPIPQPVFDYAALLSAQQVLNAIYPSAQVSTLAPPRPGSGTDPARLISDGKVDQGNALIAALRKGGYNQLVVIGKLRAPARFKLHETTVGSGHVSGMGFYIDRDLKVERVASAGSTRGFLAPYAYVKVLLVDLETLAVAKDRQVQKSRIEGTFDQTSLNPWDALSAERKSQLLNELVTAAVAEGTAALFDTR